MIILSSHLCGFKVVLWITITVSSVVTSSYALHINCESEPNIDQNFLFLDQFDRVSLLYNKGNPMQFNTCTWTYHMSALLWLKWWTYSKLQVVKSYRRLKNYPLFQGYRSFTNVLSSTTWQTGHVTGLIQQGILCVKCPTMAPGSLSWSAAIAYMSVMLIAALM